MVGFSFVVVVVVVFFVFCFVAPMAYVSAPGKHTTCCTYNPQEKKLDRPVN